MPLLQVVLGLCRHWELQELTYDPGLHYLNCIQQINGSGYSPYSRPVRPQLQYSIQLGHPSTRQMDLALNLALLWSDGWTRRCHFQHKLFYDFNSSVFLGGLLSPHTDCTCLNVANVFLSLYHHNPILYFPIKMAVAIATSHWLLFFLLLLFSLTLQPLLNPCLAEQSPAGHTYVYVKQRRFWTEKLRSCWQTKCSLSHKHFVAPILLPGIM